MFLSIGLSVCLETLYPTRAICDKSKRSRWSLLYLKVFYSANASKYEHLYLASINRTLQSWLTSPDRSADRHTDGQTTVTPPNHLIRGNKRGGLVRLQEELTFPCWGQSSRSQSAKYDCMFQRLNLGSNVKVSRQTDKRTERQISGQADRQT